MLFQIFLFLNLFLNAYLSDSCVKTYRVPKCIRTFPNVRYNQFRSSSNWNKCDRLRSEMYFNTSLLNELLIDENVPETHWIEYKKLHKKRYPSWHHEVAALRKWQYNLKRVAEHNRQYLQGKQSYTLHLNHFGDFSLTDYYNKILKLFTILPLFDPFEDHRRSAYRNSFKQDIPKEVDWRKKGFKPRLEEQWRCGACYAFAVTHAVQAQLYKARRVWTELSPQQIIDCSYSDGNMGCNGGSLRGALRYVTREGSIMEKHYPYSGKQHQCKYSKSKVVVKPRRWAMLPAGNDTAIERALATIGPLAVAVNASPFTFQLYRSGIYDDPFCIPWILNHAMLLVGYTPQYWILLNWWGKKWGENGYMRIRRGFNVCGVANMAAYVEI